MRKLRICNYGEQPEILERFESKALRLVTDAPWYVPNAIIPRDLQVPSVKEEIRPIPTQPTLKAICFQKTEETPATPSAPQIHCINM
jgi:hypothetical protein